MPAGEGSTKQDYAALIVSAWAWTTERGGTPTACAATPL